MDDQAAKLLCRHSGMRRFGAGPESITADRGYGFRARAKGASRNDGRAQWRSGIQYTFAANETGGARFLPRTSDQYCVISISMKTRDITAEDIEKAVGQLPPRELARFRAWFEAFDASQFDTAIERDAHAGTLDPLGDEGLAGPPGGMDRGLRDIVEIGKRRYAAIKENLEHDHFGAYVMINTDTSDYVVRPTITQVHTAFIERFGEDAPGWSTRIGVPIFATI